MLKFLRGQLVTLLETRKTAVADRDAILTAPQTENRDLNPAEKTAFEEKRAAVAKVDADIADLHKRIADLEEDEKRQQAANQAAAQAGSDTGKRSGGAQVTSEPEVYGRGSGNSYFLDLARAQVQNDAQAMSRLQRHGKELDVILPKREAQRAARADQEMRSAFGEGGGFEKRVNPNRTDGQGGFFVPPIWLIDDYVAFLRAGRTFANALRPFTLPAGTDSINIPKVASGTATAVQTADAGAVSSVDLTDTSVVGGVKTIAGQQDVAMQLLDQSPVSFDEIVMTDLMADYNQKLDVQALYGTNASGQVKGATVVAGINTVTFTSASPTGPLLYVPIGQSVSKIAGQRFLPPTAFFVHPRRWYWLATQLDTGGRPLVVPAQAQEFNPLALQTGVVSEGPVGFMFGLPVFIDPNITTVGLAGAQTGGTEDQIIAARTSDLYLFEGNLRTRVMTEVLSGTLQVRIQLYNYVALIADRYPVAISVISGTGMQAPAGF